MGTHPVAGLPLTLKSPTWLHNVIMEATRLEKDHSHGWKTCQVSQILSPENWLKYRHMSWNTCIGKYHYYFKIVCPIIVKYKKGLIGTIVDLNLYAESWVSCIILFIHACILKNRLMRDTMLCTPPLFVITVQFYARHHYFLLSKL